MKFKEFKLNESQKILVSRNERENSEFVSTIEYMNPQFITITLPLLNQEIMDLKRGDEVYVRILMGSSTLEFYTRVRSFRQDNVLLIDLEHPDEYKRVQRRSSVRMKTLINIKVAAVPEDASVDPRFTSATALDISAGGMEIMTTEPYEKDSNVHIKFGLEIDRKTTHSFSVMAQVRRVVQASPRKFKIGVEFTSMSMTDSDKIFQYIFKKSAERNFWKR